MTKQASVKFQRIGGSRQLCVCNENDFRNVLKLDPAHWAMTSIRAEAIRCDAAFLKLMLREDSERIRVGAVRELLSWMLETLADLRGAIDGSDAAGVSAINGSSADGAVICATIREALGKLGRGEDEALSIGQIHEYKQTILATALNGDGVIPPETVEDGRLADFIRLVMSVAGGRKDVSGAEGVGNAELDLYLKTASDYLAWKQKGAEKAGDIYAYGEATPGLYARYQAIKEDVGRFFDSCRALVYRPAQDIRNKYDPMDQASYGTFFDKAPIAPASSEFVLRLSEGVNPAKSAAFRGFLEAYRGVVSGAEGELTLAEWETFRAKIAAYEGWISTEVTGIPEGVSVERIRESLSWEGVAVLRDLIARDAVVAGHIAGCDIVEKLLLCQKHMRLFLNNFASMQALFSQREPSLLLAGKLIMDGRHFGLAVPVADFAAHKAIAERSNLCVMYVRATHGTGAGRKAMTIAVGVTAGSMRNLFIGKTGLFHTATGEVWDAEVTDFIRQPVSAGEVILLPFLKLGELLKKHADKYLADRSKNYEARAGAATQGASQGSQGIAGGGMLLMGGSIGVAAIGSSFAFMAKTLKDVSCITVLSVLGGIVFVFGAPFLISGFHKLRNRSLSLFLEANGCAMNRKMRMTFKLGRYFTYTPRLPNGSRRR